MCVWLAWKRYWSAKRRSAAELAPAERRFAKGILRRSGHVVLDLRNERRHQVEGLVDVRELVQQLHHAVIILERVQARPGQAVLGGHQVLVVGLVHVPEKDDAYH